jgi:hypothetical protein
MHACCVVYFLLNEKGRLILSFIKEQKFSLFFFYLFWGCGEGNFHELSSKNNFKKAGTFYISILKA